MTLLSIGKKKILPTLIASVLAFSFVLAPISQTLTVQKAEAAWDDVVAEYGTWAATLASMISDAATAAGITSLTTKEYVLDGIAWQLVNLTIQEMIKSTTKWVNSGFEGSPAFVTDLNGFLLNIADQVAGDYIFGSPLKFLCSPFKLNIQLALKTQYNRSRKVHTAQCTLSKVVQNMENFMAGDFLAGGWDGWYNMTLIQENNIYGAQLKAEAGLSAAISSAQYGEMKLLEFGKGFLSKKNADGTITTPGTVIEEQLNSALNLPAQRLVVADELNELIGALFSQLAGAALSGVGGLLGLTEPSYGSGDYFDRMAAQGNQGSQNIQGTANSGNAVIQNTITFEERYLNLQNNIIAYINDASTYKSRTYPDRDEDEDGDVEPNSCHSGTLTSSLSNQLSTARRTASSTQTTIATLTVFRTDFALLDNTSTSRTVINGLLQKYNASSVPAAQAAIMDQYMVFQNSGSLHNANDIVQTERTTIPALQTEISSFTGSIDRACEENNY